MSYEIAVIADVHLLPEAENQIINLAPSVVVFPSEETPPPTEELIARTGSADAILVSPGTPITEDYLQACPTVKYIGICGTSTENVAVDVAEQRGITVTNVVDYGDEPTAEFIFMQLARLARGIGDYQWRDDPIELMGKSVGIVGLGALGQAVARLAIAYKMNVTYNSRTRKPEWEEQGVQYLEKPDLLAQNEIIVLTGPTNLQLVESEDFEVIRPNTILLQASQGNCFDRAGFLKWIVNNSNFAIFDFAAGSDNYEAYKDLPRVIFPKVIAGHTLETRRRLGDKVVANLRNYLDSTQA